jgi:hypothetical protein
MLLRARLAGRAVLVAAAVMASCDGTARPIADPADLHVLVVMPYTGSFRTRSEQHRTAVQMAFRDLEQGGTLVPGRRLRAWEVDATSDAAECERRVRALVAESLTDARTGEPMVTAIISSTTAAFQGSLPVALELRVPHIEISSGSHFEEFPGIRRRDHADMTEEQYASFVSFSFSTRPLCTQEAIMTADFIASRPEWQRVVLMRGDKTHDTMHTTVIRERLALLADPTDPANPMRSSPWTGTVLDGDPGGEGSDYVMTYDSDWSVHFRAVAAMDPDVVFYHLNGDSVNFDFLEQASIEDFPAPIVTCNMSEKQELLDPVNPGIVDWLAGRLWFVGRRPIRGDALTTFREDYKAFAGFDADAWSPSGYDAGVLIGLGVVGAHQATGGVLPEAIRDAMEAVSGSGEQVGYGALPHALELIRAGADVDYDGPSGTLEVRDDRSVPGEFMVDQVTFDPETGQGQYPTLPDPPPRVL